MYTINVIPNDIKENMTGSGLVAITYGKLFVFDKDKQLDVWPYWSGGWGKGPIPRGIYILRNIVRLEDTENNKAFKRDGFPWYAELECPEYVLREGRDSLGIHPEGNLPGTLGCVGIIERDPQCYSLLYVIIKISRQKNERIKVYAI